MYRMLIYISGSIYETTNGACVPNEIVNEKRVGYVEGMTVKECEDKFMKMVPDGFVELRKNET